MLIRASIRKNRKSNSFKQFKGYGGKAVTPGILFGKGQIPKFVRGGIARQLAFLAGLHVNAIDTLSIGSIGKAHGYLF